MAMRGKEIKAKNTTMKVGDSTSREGSRAAQVRISGLCVTCTNNTHCTFLRQPNHPVLQCDELE
jgi:hypothetical protein